MGLSIKASYPGILLLLVLFAACKSTEHNSESILSNTNVYAEHFQILEYGNYHQLNILNPWQESDGVMFQYYLANNKKNIPDSIRDHNIIITPLKRVVCMSTTQIAFIDQIGVLDAIHGVSGKKYVFNDEILNNANIKDVGYDSGMNYELIIEIAPDMVLLYGVSSDITGITKKLNDLGIQTMIIAEHLESTPLAKLEWIKVFGALFEKEMISNEYFDQISGNYNNLVSILSDTLSEPKVLTGLPYKDIWYMSSANTNISKLITDGGGEYIWNHKTNGDISSCDIEAVMLKSGHADIWINTGTASNKNEILAMDKRLGKIEAFKKNQVYNNNKRLNKYGGNDYYESGVVRPDLLLKDMIKIIHPEIMTDYDFHYYNKLK